MFSLLKYRKQIIAIILAVPDLIRAVEKLARQIKEAKKDNNITLQEVLGMVETGLDGIMDILGKIKVAFL